MITLEVSAYAARFREQRGPALRARLEPYRAPSGELPPALQPLAAQLELPFELRAARAHAAASGAELALLGDDDESRELLATLERELLAPDNLAKLAPREAPTLAAAVEAAWTRARRELDHPLPRSTADARWLADTDARLAAAIRLHAAGERRVVHVGGYEHLPGLRLALADLEPEVVLLRG